MIKNARQLRVSERKRKDLSDALEADRDRLAAMPNDVAQLLRSGAESVVQQLVDEILAYQELSEDPPSRIEYEGIGELAHSLVRARIASGLTQAELADRIGVHENQIQKYESTDYEQASLARLREIEDAMPVLFGEARRRQPAPRPAWECNHTGVPQALESLIRTYSADPEFDWTGFDDDR